VPFDFAQDSALVPTASPAPAQRLAGPHLSPRSAGEAERNDNAAAERRRPIGGASRFRLVAFVGLCWGDDPPRPRVAPAAQAFPPSAKITAVRTRHPPPPPSPFSRSEVPVITLCQTGIPVYDGTFLELGPRVLHVALFFATVRCVEMRIVDSSAFPL